MERVRGVVQPRPRPGRVVGAHAFRADRAVPPFDRLLVRSDVLVVAEADQRRADEPAALALDDQPEPLDEVRLDDHVVVQEESEAAARLVDQELALLGHASSRQVAMDLDAPVVERKDPQDGTQLRAGVLGRLVALVGDDDPEVGQRLRVEGQEGERERRGAVASRDEDVEHQ
jgi:hypothetical protein